MAQQRWWRRLKPDGFLVAIVATAIFATLVPVSGAGVPVVTWASRITVGILFFLYGVRLERAEAVAGLKHWRLHAMILGFTYVMFPIIGLALGFLRPFLEPDLFRGILLICIVPGTVQSAINFTSIARGNVAGAIVASSLSNMLGVVFTPLLAMALMRTTGLHISVDSILDIGLQVLFPFILGQVVRTWVWPVVKRYPKLKYFDQLTIMLVVYQAFSSGMREGVWNRTSIGGIFEIIGIILVILCFMLWLSWRLAAWTGFNRRDQIAIQFCGTKKSLTTGVPMASLLFAGSAVSLIVLPLMIFHQVQLMVCSVLAARYSERDEAWHEVTNRR